MNKITDICNNQNSYNENSLINYDLHTNSIAGWAFSETEIHAAIHSELLINPSIDLSNPCNLNCPYCFIEKKDSERKIRHQDELHLVEIKELLRDFASVGASTVNIVGAGEPTIDPNFEKVVEQISSSGMTPLIFTNGIRLAERPRLIDFLFNAGSSIVIKYNSLRPRVQDLVVGSKGYSVLRDSAIKSLIKRGFNSDTPTRMAFDIIAFKGILDEIPIIYSDCRKRNIYPIIADFIPTGRTEHGEFVGQASIRNFPEKEKKEVKEILQPLSQIERSSLYKTLKNLDEEKFKIKHYSFPAYYNGSPCTQILGIYVDEHGNIWPCVARSRCTKNGLEPGLLGNIRDVKAPSYIWKNHPSSIEIRSKYNGCCPFKAIIQTSEP